MFLFFCSRNCHGKKNYWNHYFHKLGKFYQAILFFGNYKSGAIWEGTSHRLRVTRWITWWWFWNRGEKKSPLHNIWTHPIMRIFKFKIVSLEAQDILLCLMLWMWKILKWSLKASVVETIISRALFIMLENYYSRYRWKMCGISSSY